MENNKEKNIHINFTLSLIMYKELLEQLPTYGFNSVQKLIRQIIKYHNEKQSINR